MVLYILFLSFQREDWKTILNWTVAYMIGDLFPAGAGNFSLQHRVQTSSGAQPASYPMDTGGLFPWG
jgi:hypothetical protein